MKRLIYLLTLILVLCVCAGCGNEAADTAQTVSETAAAQFTAEPSAARQATAAPRVTDAPRITAEPQVFGTPEPSSPQKTKKYSKNDISDEALAYAESVITQDGVYTTPAMVAAYIDRYNKLPSNYITKKEAQSLGWDSAKGNLDTVAKGKSIGGDSFGNREGKLPVGKKYKECDVNYNGGYRGAERLIFSTDGDVYYTNDHYNTFKKLY